MVVDRQKDRQKDRKTDRKTERQTDRKTDRQTDKVSYRGASLLKIVTNSFCCVSNGLCMKSIGVVHFDLKEGREVILIFQLCRMTCK